ncbi:MAG TPA: heme-copper oxidase subunit III [Streptosporangiaceae bacterium]|nr:heme-copper oxidase subunit III [Streptosporangiaceae bacterium]
MTAIPMLQPTTPWTLPRRGPVGILLFILAESSIFAVFVAAYLFYIGRSLTGPTPREVLQFPVVMTVCLLSSSLTVHLATRALRNGALGRFLRYWLATVLLGAGFLAGTAREWHELIAEHHLTISTNLFGSTYYALVGLHASHVIAGMVMLLIVAAFGLAGRIRPVHVERADVISIYWHFVDVVWIVVVTVVYVIGR